MLVRKPALRLCFLPFSKRNVLSFGGFFKVRMGERSVRIREVKGSNPSRSIKSKTPCLLTRSFLFIQDPDGFVRGSQPPGMSNGDAAASGPGGIPAGRRLAATKAPVGLWLCRRRCQGPPPTTLHASPGPNRQPCDSMKPQDCLFFCFAFLYSCSAVQWSHLSHKALI